MKKSIFLLFLILLSFSVSYSQDTVSLYFEVNNFSLSNHNKIVMDSLFETYTAHDLDSIYFIGMTDSVGHLKSNLKLSQKRSNSVKTYFSTHFSDRIPYSNFALGENNTKSLKESRRVDVLIFKSKVYYASDWRCGGNPTIAKQCYLIAYDVVNNCKVTEIKKGRKTLVQLEHNLPDSLFKKPHYIGSVINGKFNYRRIRWKTKTTGKLWWRKKRRVALIPKNSFDEFKLFTLNSNQDCTGCMEDFDQNLKIRNETICKKSEYNLMTNSQYKPLLLNRKKIRIRTPKEYVNLNRTYFLSCDEEKNIEWTTKKFLGRTQYYYTTIELNNYSYNISSWQLCCDSSEDFDCNKRYNFGVMMCGGDKSNLIGIRLKSNGWIQDNEFQKYVGLGYFYAYNKNIFELSLGYFPKGKGISTLSYDYDFLSFPANIVQAFSWSDRAYRRYNDFYFSLYAGTELQAVFSKNNPLALSQDIHAGLSFQLDYYNKYVPRVFIQNGWITQYGEEKWNFTNKLTFGISFLVF